MKIRFDLRHLLTIYTLAWVAILTAICSFLLETVSRNLGDAIGGAEELRIMPMLTKHVAVPMVGGLTHIYPPFGRTWFTYVGWGILYMWPVANVGLLWRFHRADRARQWYLYSSIGYLLFFSAMAVAVAIGLAVLFLY